jgi:Ser/Thr protein kinase RdoA (MazF antagonist)
MKLIQTWDEWCEVYHSLEFWREEIGWICERHSVELKQIDPTYPGTNAVFFVNQDIVLKIYCPVHNNSSAVEYELLTHLLNQKHLFPQLLFHGQTATGYEYIALTRLNGTPVRELESKTLPDCVLQELADAIIDLQNRTLDKTGGELRCLVHYDLSEDHIYLDSNGQLQGIIDFGDAITGHPSDEFPVLFADCFYGNDSQIERFKTIYNTRSNHYQITDPDLLMAFHRHPFKHCLLNGLQRYDTKFSRMMREVDR